MLRGLSGCDFYERGLALKKVEIFDMAVAEFREATRDPKEAGKAFAQMALCLKRLGRDDEAVTALREALAIEAFSPVERVHMQYLLAQTLESLDRNTEALMVYRMIRREQPNFQHVDKRIQILSLRLLGSRQPVTAHQSGDLPGLWSQLKPQLTSLVNQTWQRLAHHGETLDARPKVTNMTLSAQKRDDEGERSALAQNGPDRRGQGRVAVQMLSQFFSKAHTVAGEGEVRDLSPSGCRITSPIRVTPGTAVECWIYPQDGQPLAVDEATVQWVGHREFGLRFSKVRLAVQRQITDMC
jgi:tetratricopeptide (TPR) repeat protein